MNRAEQIIHAEIKTQRKSPNWKTWWLWIFTGLMLCGAIAILYFAGQRASDYLQNAEFEKIKNREMLAGAKSELKLMDGMLSARDNRISELEEALQLARAVPAESVNNPNAMVITDDSPSAFTRNHDKPLVDDLNNPGGLLAGSLSKPYCKGVYQAGRQNHAICETRSHGVAALINIIMTHKDRQIKHYIGGGDGRDDPWWNYTGGNSKATAVYLETFEDAGINIEHRINGNLDQLKRLIRGHARVEGSQIPVTDDEIDAALELYQGSR